MNVLTRYQLRMAMADQDEALLARLKVTCWRESYVGILPDALLDSLDVNRSVRQWTSSLTDGIAWVAEQTGEGVGFSHMHRDEVTMLYVRKADQGCGIGRELLLHGFEEIACLGHRQAHLWVLENNPVARSFYASMGGLPVDKRPVGFPRWPELMEVRYDYALEDILGA